jgi:hypothetical protein
MDNIDNKNIRNVNKNKRAKRSLLFVYLLVEKEEGQTIMDKYCGLIL